MKPTLLVLALLLPGMAGCFGGGPIQVELAPSWTPHTAFTYEVQDADGSFTARFVVGPASTRRLHVLDHGYVPRPVYAGLLMVLDHEMAPVGPRWGGLLPFPIATGTEHPATVDGVNVTLALGVGSTKVTGSKLAVVTLRVVDGPDVFEADFSPALGTYTRFVVRDDGGPVKESWTLDGPVEALPWGGPVPWVPGDYWSFDAMTAGLATNLTLVHTQKAIEDFEFIQVNVNNAVPLLAADRTVATPFLRIEPNTMHPRSGFYSALLSKSFDMPLIDGAQWSSFAGNVPFGARATYDPDIQFAGGSAYGFRIELRTESGPLATYDYVPDVKWFTHFLLRDSNSKEVVINWTLTGFGRGFRGTIEETSRISLMADSIQGRNHTQTFEFPDNAQFLDFQVRFLLTQNAGSPSVVLTAPDGSEALRRVPDACGQPTCFVPDNDILDGIGGTWTLDASSPSGTTIDYDVRALTVTPEEYDFSGSKS